MTAEAGRDPIPIAAWYPPRDLAPMHRYRDIGVERVVFTVPSAGAEIVLPALDEIGATMREANG